MADDHVNDPSSVQSLRYACSRCWRLLIGDGVQVRQLGKNDQPTRLEAIAPTGIKEIAIDSINHVVTITPNPRRTEYLCLAPKIDVYATADPNEFRIQAENADEEVVVLSGPEPDRTVFLVGKPPSTKPPQDTLPAAWIPITKKWVEPGKGDS
jgi:hypothetical protein